LRTGTDEQAKDWIYRLGFKSEGRGRQRLLVTEETVELNGKRFLARPDEHDLKDTERLTQTHLEQVNANGDFRELADFFATVTYLHLVPQLLKFGDRIAGNRLEEDPFGQGFLERLARTPERTRKSRLNKLQQALVKAVPQFLELRFERAKATGHPHLEARYAHWRPQGAWHREDQFSDGTLRLIALLWSLLEGDSLLLLEEPELSLNDAVVQQIPLMIERIQKQAKYRRQVLISSHSETLLHNPIDGRGVLLLTPGDDGTVVRSPNQEEIKMMKAGLSPAEVLLPKTRPQDLEQLEWSL
jgi:predicted ATPase